MYLNLEPIQRIPLFSCSLVDLFVFIFRTHPAYSLVFLLSGGGKLNYAGTKRWLEEHLDHDATSDLLSNVKFILCLDSLGKDK